MSLDIEQQKEAYRGKIWTLHAYNPIATCLTILIKFEVLLMFLSLILSCIPYLQEGTTVGPLAFGSSHVCPRSRRCRENNSAVLSTCPYCTYTLSHKKDTQIFIHQSSNQQVMNMDFHKTANLSMLYFERFWTMVM